MSHMRAMGLLSSGKESVVNPMNPPTIRPPAAAPQHLPWNAYKRAVAAAVRIRNRAVVL